MAIYPLENYKIEKVLPFVGDFDTAYAVEDYPYGRLKCTMKFWLDYRPGQQYGFRLVTCSLNPKTGKWNKPHSSTYSQAMALYIERETGHIKHAALSYYDADIADEYYEMFKDGLSSEGKNNAKYWHFLHLHTAGRNLTKKEYLEVMEKTKISMLEWWTLENSTPYNPEDEE